MNNNEYSEMINYRKKIDGWESMRTLIWNNHQWNFFKPIFTNTEKDPLNILKYYFTEKTKKFPNSIEKEIKKTYKYIEQLTWFPLERLYIKAKYENEKTKEIKILNLEIQDHKKFFLEKSKINSAYFYNWVLYVSDWENITTINDVLEKFFILYNKFQYYIQSDINFDILKETFNKFLLDLKEQHSISPIIDVDEKIFYQFVTHPEIYKVSPLNGLKKLFFHIENSDFLKGVGPFQSWQPSFEKYVNNLSHILSFKYTQYNKNSKIVNNFRRLKEHEIKIFDSDENNTYISPDGYIPNKIKLTYRIKGWEDAEEEKAEKISLKELNRYINTLSLGKDDINTIAKELKEKHLSKYSIDYIQQRKKVMQEATKKRSEIRKKYADELNKLDPKEAIKKILEEAKKENINKEKNENSN